MVVNVLHVDQFILTQYFLERNPEVSMSTHVAWAAVAVVLLSTGAEGAVSLFVTSYEVSTTTYNFSTFHVTYFSCPELRIHGTGRPHSCTGAIHFSAVTNSSSLVNASIERGTQKKHKKLLMRTT